MRINSPDPHGVCGSIRRLGLARAVKVETVVAVLHCLNAQNVMNRRCCFNSFSPEVWDIGDGSVVLAVDTHTFCPRSNPLLHILSV